MSSSNTSRGSLAWKGVALALVIAALVLSRPDLASAHANLADADPAPNSVLEAPPSRITIWFTEPLEPSFSTIEVLDSQGTRVDNDDSAVDPRDPTVMYVTVPDDLPNGTYTVAWRNLSTVDGHTIRGTFFYSVGEPLSAQASDLPSEPALQSPAEPFMRWAVLLGGLTVLGVLMLWLVVLRPPLVSMSDTDDLVARVRDRTDKTVMVGVVVALMGSLGHLLVQASSVHEVSLLETLGEPIRFVITQTEWGRGWLQRTSLLIGALRSDTGICCDSATGRPTAAILPSGYRLLRDGARHGDPQHDQPRRGNAGDRAGGHRHRLYSSPCGGLLGWRSVRARAYSPGRFLPFA